MGFRVLGISYLGFSLELYYGSLVIMIKVHIDKLTYYY